MKLKLWRLNIVEGNIVYKSTSEFLKFISDRTKSKNNKTNKNHTKNHKNKSKDSSVVIQPNNLNY